MSKIRVAWLCPYNQKEFSDIIDIPETRKKTMHPAGWISTLVNEMGSRQDVELHVITYTSLITKDIHVKRGNVNFYWFWTGMPFVKKGFPSNYSIEQLCNFYWLRKRIVKLLNKLDPDIVNLHGTEHPLAAVINHVKQPVVVEIQGFMNSHYPAHPSAFNKIRCQIENKVLAGQKHFIIHTAYMANMIKKFNSNPSIYTAHYPVDESIYAVNGNPKKHDLAFFARLTKAKGVDDFIKTVNLVKKSIPNINAVLMGIPENKEFEQYLKKMIAELDLTANVKFVGFVEHMSDLMALVQSCKVVVFPTKADTSPGTVSQSQILGTPVVSYRVDGIPDMIEHKKTGMLAELNDIEGLATHTLELLQNNELYNQIVVQARKFAEQEYRTVPIVDKMLAIYKQVMSCYNTNK